MEPTGSCRASRPGLAAAWFSIRLVENWLSSSRGLAVSCRASSQGLAGVLRLSFSLSRNPGAGRRAVRKEAGRVFPLLNIYFMAFSHIGVDVCSEGRLFSSLFHRRFSDRFNPAARQLSSLAAFCSTVLLRSRSWEFLCYWVMCFGKKPMLLYFLSQ